MSTIEIRVTDTVTVANFKDELAKGNVQFYRVRGNGTTRHIPVFAEGTKEFEQAEYVAEQREEGVSMKALATELHLSVPSVRRLINSYLLSDEVADYEPEDIEELLASAREEEPVAEGNEEPQWVIGAITGPAEDGGDHHCAKCGDALEEGNICNECFAKYVTNA
jgi:hypothetical protein